MLAAILTAFLIFFSTGVAPVDSAKCNSEDKKVLLKIKEFWGNPYHLSGWTTDYGCCDWAGITCDEKTNRVTGLDVSTDTEISGTIPPAVAELPYMTSLWFHKLPKLAGPIIPEIGMIKNLNFLAMDWNGLSGPIPAFLANLEKLEYINLSFNRFTGSIPPGLSSLPKLNYIRFDRNQLTGAIPSDFGKFKSGTTIRLGHNNLTGSLPKSLGNVDFNTFDVSRNKLTGDASFLFGESKSTFEIDLSRNMFAFDLSNVRFPKQLGWLLMDHNAIYGTIPKQIIKLPNFQNFNVSYNRLCGEIPQGGSLNRFDKWIYAHNKCLCGQPLAPCTKSTVSIGAKTDVLFL